MMKTLLKALCSVFALAGCAEAPALPVAKAALDPVTLHGDITLQRAADGNTYTSNDKSKMYCRTDVEMNRGLTCKAFSDVDSLKDLKKIEELRLRRQTMVASL